jgi:hypothetical protein
MGICTTCGYITKKINELEEEKHTCDENFVKLGTTDWQVTRYKEQVEAGVPTTMTKAEYDKLLQDRQTARDSIVSVSAAPVEKPAP